VCFIGSACSLKLKKIHLGMILTKFFLFERGITKRNSKKKSILWHLKKILNRYKFKLKANIANDIIIIVIILCEKLYPTSSARKLLLTFYLICCGQSSKVSLR